MTASGVLGLLLIGFVFICYIFFKLSEKQRIKRWIKLIFSLCTGWLTSFVVIASLIYLRRGLQMPVEMMNITITVTVIAFIFFQILLYKFFDNKT